MTDPALTESFTVMPLPPARGELSAAVITRLRGEGPDIGVAQVKSAIARAGSVLDDDDCQLTLTLLYELHLRGIGEVPDEMQWAPDLLAVRSVLEEAMWAEVAALLHSDTVAEAASPRWPARAGAQVDAARRSDIVAERIETSARPASATVERLWQMTADDDGPGLSSHIRDDATLAELREVLIHRSPYQLREADVHTLGIPRLSGQPKAALIEVQADEYGGGQLSHMHSVLFAQTMIAAGLSARYMHYLPRVPAVTLASLNVLSYFGLHRNRLGELIGHLAAIEMTSSAPAKRYSAGLARLGFDTGARKFYDEHIEADAVHEQIVARDLVAQWVGEDAARSRQVLDGAAAFLLLEQRIGDHVLSSWMAGRSSLLESP